MIAVRTALAPVTTCPRRGGAASPRRARETEGRIVILTFPPGYVNAPKAYVPRDKTLLKRRGRKGERQREGEKEEMEISLGYPDRL